MYVNVAPKLLSHCLIYLSTPTPSLYLSEHLRSSFPPSHHPPSALPPSFPPSLPPDLRDISRASVATPPHTISPSARDKRRSVHPPHPINPGATFCVFSLALVTLPDSDVGGECGLRPYSELSSSRLFFFFFC